MSKYPEYLHIVCVAEPKQRAVEAVHCPNLEVHGYNDKYGYKSPKMGYDSGYLTYNPTYNYPWNLRKILEQKKSEAC